MAGLPPPPTGGHGGPPGHYAYATYAPAPAFRAFDGLATAATVCLGIMAAVALFGLGAHLNRVGLMERDFRAGDLSLDELEGADNLVGAAAVIDAVGLLATAAVFITWQHRHAVNADSLAGAPAGLGPGWAIAGWFVPCANWLLPGMQLFGASRAADPALPLRPAAGRGRGSPLVVLWAVMFGLGNALGLAGWAKFPDEGAVSTFSDLEAYLSDATLADRMVAAGFVVSAAAAIVAAVMVRTLTQRQAERAVAITAAAAAAYAPYAAPAPPPPPPWTRPPNAWGPPPS